MYKILHRIKISFYLVLVLPLLQALFCSSLTAQDELLEKQQRLLQQIKTTFETTPQRNISATKYTRTLGAFFTLLEEEYASLCQQLTTYTCSPLSPSGVFTNALQSLDTTLAVAALPHSKTGIALFIRYIKIQLAKITLVLNNPSPKTGYDLLKNYALANTALMEAIIVLLSTIEDEYDAAQQNTKNLSALPNFIELKEMFEFFSTLPAALEQEAALFLSKSTQQLTTPPTITPVQTPWYQRIPASLIQTLIVIIACGAGYYKLERTLCKPFEEKINKENQDYVEQRNTLLQNFKETGGKIEESNQKTRDKVEAFHGDLTTVVNRTGTIEQNLKDILGKFEVMDKTLQQNTADLEKIKANVKRKKNVKKDDPQEDKKQQEKGRLAHLFSPKKDKDKDKEDHL